MITKKSRRISLKTSAMKTLMATLRQDFLYQVRISTNFLVNYAIFAVFLGFLDSSMQGNWNKTFVNLVNHTNFNYKAILSAFELLSTESFENTTDFSRIKVKPKKISRFLNKFPAERERSVDELAENADKFRVFLGNSRERALRQHLPKSETVLRKLRVFALRQRNRVPRPGKVRGSREFLGDEMVGEERSA